jgi:superfamily I DNA/RNA helicase
VKELLKKVDEWQEREVAASLDTRNEESRIRKVEDKADCLRVIAEGCASISDVVTNTKALFADFDPDGTPRKSVVLSSIHRAKGLESDRVFWLSSAERASSKKGFTPGWKEVQEENLKYVATTRAKNSLVLES